MIERCRARSSRSAWDWHRRYVSRREPPDAATPRRHADIQCDRAAGRRVPARIRTRPAPRDNRPNAGAARRPRRESAVAPRRTARRASRDRAAARFAATPTPTSLEARGRFRKYASAVAPSTCSTAPSMRICRSSSTQKKTRAACGCAFKLASLAALVVRIEREPARVVVLEQDDARRGPAAGVDGGQRHRIGFGHARRDRRVEPLGELAMRIAIDAAFVE